MPTWLSDSLAHCAIALSATRAVVTVHDGMTRIPRIALPWTAGLNNKLAAISGATTLGYSLCGGSRAVLVTSVAIQTGSALLALVVRRDCGEAGQ